MNQQQEKGHLMERRKHDMLDNGNGLAALRGRSLEEIAKLARLADAERLAALAEGYAEALPGDITYPDLFMELKHGGWQELDEVPATDREARGYRCALRRGGHVLVLWLTGPYAIARAESSTLGRLVDRREIGMVITALPGTEIDPGAPHAACPWSRTPEFDGSRSLISYVLIRNAWRAHADGTWSHPAHATKLFVRTVERTLYVRYWAGAVIDADELARVADRS